MDNSLRRPRPVQMIPTEGYSLQNEHLAKSLPGTAAQRPSIDPGRLGSTGDLGAGGSPDFLRNALSPTGGVFPGSRAVGRGFVEDAQQAFRAPTGPAKVGQFLRAAGKATLAAPLGLAEDIIEPATRFMRPVTDNTVEALKVAATGDNTPIIPPTGGTTTFTPAASAARDPNQTAATAARTNVNLRNVSMQGGRGMVNPETIGQANTRADATERMLAPSTTGRLPRDLAGIEAGKIYKTIDPKTGSTVYSGRDVQDGAPMVNAAGTEIASRGSVSSVPAMSPTLVKSTLTNPDGSTWSGADNATMAANLRDGVSPYRGTSRQAGEDAAAEQLNLRRLALSPLGTPGRTPALKLLTEQAQQETLRRGQDMQAATGAASSQATLRAAQIKAASDESKALRDQANADRTFRAGRDDAAAALEGRRRDDKRASAKAFSDRVLTMVGTVDGKPDLETAATITNGANAFLANKMVEIEALLKADPKNQKALALKRDIETNGLDSIDEDTMRTLVLGQKANRVAKENDGWTINPWAGTAVNTDTPVTSLREQRNMILPNQYITNNGQKIPAGAIEDNPDLRRLIVR